MSRIMCCKSLTSEQGASGVKERQEGKIGAAALSPMSKELL
jgi:hypothetical protein